MSWRSCQLGDVIELRYGKSLPDRDRKHGEIPVYGSGGIGGWHNTALVPGPGIIVGRKGSVGSVFYESRNFFPIDTAYYVVPKEGQIDLRYAYYLLRSLPLPSMNSDVAVPGLNRDRALGLAVRVPSLPRQMAIADILFSYDDLIENNRRRMALLEESARLLYREWFVHLRFPGHEHTPIVDGEPQGWERVLISDFGTIITGKTPSTKDSDNYGGDIPFVKTPDMHGNAFVLKSETYLTEKGAKSQANKFLPPGSLLVSCIGTIGVVSLTSELCQFNQQINAVIPNEKFLRYYCYFSLKEMKPRLDAIGGGVTMANVSKSKFENMDLTLPNSTLLHNFDEFAVPAFEQIKNLASQNQKLRAARDLLLPRLMSGELAV